MTARGQAIVLIGFMGAGKSSVGRRLARRTGFPRLDTDELIADGFGQPISRIFELHGENAFRNAETETLRKLDPSRASIVVTGGGILLHPGNAGLLRRLGLIVYLMADEETLFHRVSKRSSRPLLQTDDPSRTIKELLQTRRPLYEKAADITVDTSHLGHDEVAELILRRLDELRKK
jgi:shikimate kinase